jgi:hypothetical protein
MSARVNFTTGELDALRRIADARRELGEIADYLLHEPTSKRPHREDFGRRLNAVKASLGTVEQLVPDLLAGRARGET